MVGLSLGGAPSGPTSSLDFFFSANTSNEGFASRGRGGPHKTEPEDTTESSDVGSVRGTESGSSRSDLQPDWTERKEKPFFLSEKPFYNVVQCTMLRRNWHQSLLDWASPSDQVVLTLVGPQVT